MHDVRVISIECAEVMGQDGYARTVESVWQVLDKASVWQKGTCTHTKYDSSCIMCLSAQVRNFWGENLPLLNINHCAMCFLVGFYLIVPSEHCL